MKKIQTQTLLLSLLLILSGHSYGWDKICTFEGAGVGEISFQVMHVYRQANAQGSWDYRLEFPVANTIRCLPGQKSVAKVWAKFWMTNNVTLHGDTNKYGHGQSLYRTQFNRFPYAECLDSNWEIERICTF